MNEMVVMLFTCVAELLDNNIVLVIGIAILQERETVTYGNWVSLCWQVNGSND